MIFYSNTALSLALILISGRANGKPRLDKVDEGMFVYIYILSLNITIKLKCIRISAQFFTSVKTFLLRL